MDIITAFLGGLYNTQTFNHKTTNITILSNYKHNNTKGHEANHNYDTKHLNK